MQTIEITRATVAGGRRVAAGEIVELVENHAAELIALGKAVPVVANTPPDNREKDVEKKISKRTISTKKKKA